MATMKISDLQFSSGFLDPLPANHWASCGQEMLNLDSKSFEIRRKLNRKFADHRVWGSFCRLSTYVWPPFCDVTAGPVKESTKYRNYRISSLLDQGGYSKKLFPLIGRRA